ncbi:MAG: DUF1893 domain-containing protein [Deltaproteobacteria bacterium]|nr:DUF1893 domain-containing protein [Deltaproteobacteria bacterium]MBW2594622.1 DUF1893 domain-containing protein [Deltaproteobacteria bacterium]MBW2650296.1 DUF1893 domain-containing protein [Deltaproteobacteria bacterium]
MKTVNAYFESFLKSDDTIRIISPDGKIFRSQRKGISPLLNYIEQNHPHMDEVVILDKVTGNAAALLMKKALCREVFSTLGSRPAAETLKIFGIASHFTKMVPYIINREGNGMCPFEKMSMGKSPDEFYNLVKNSPLLTGISSSDRL